MSKETPNRLQEHSNYPCFTGSDAYLFRNRYLKAVSEAAGVSTEDLHATLAVLDCASNEGEAYTTQTNVPDIMLVLGKEGFIYCTENDGIGVEASEDHTIWWAILDKAICTLN